MSDETVWTSRRAFLLEGGRWTPGRLRVSDRLVRFTAYDGTVVEVVEVLGAQVVRRPRRVLVLHTATGPVRLRCFAMPAIAALLTR
jgi:hypothetical protein